MMRPLLSLLLVCLVAGGAGAQDRADHLVTAAYAAAEPTPVQVPFSIGVVAVDAIDSVTPVTNAPYSAEAITEVVQTLADGNRIEQRTSATIARDSRGRIRREQHGIALGAFLAQSESPLVTITDAAARRHVILNYDQRVAYQSRAIAFAPAVEVRQHAIDRAPRAAAAVPGAGPAELGFTFEVPPELSARTDAATAGQESQRGANVRREALPGRQMEGLRVEGTRTVTVIPAGSMGNALPIEVVSERWYSPELQVVVYTRRSDPRFGETIYRLTNIVRAEPPADLFEVPPDFRIEDAPAAEPVPARRIPGGR